MLKEHKEFHSLDLATGWSTPDGYPSGIEEKILSGSLNYAAKTGHDCSVLSRVYLLVRRLSTTIGRKSIFSKGTLRSAMTTKVQGESPSNHIPMPAAHRAHFTALLNLNKGVFFWKSITTSKFS